VLQWHRVALDSCSSVHEGAFVRRSSSAIDAAGACAVHGRGQPRHGIATMAIVAGLARRSATSLVEAREIAGGPRRRGVSTGFIMATTCLDHDVRGRPFGALL
jgi:hypothetical protein